MVCQYTCGTQYTFPNSQLCKAAGITGYKTNHSVIVTAATCLFHSGVDEQLIMSRTGHQSHEGVRTSSDQKLAISSVVNNATAGLEALNEEIITDA